MPLNYDLLYGSRQDRSVDFDDQQWERCLTQDDCERQKKNSFFVGLSIGVAVCPVVIYLLLKVFG